MRQKNLIYKGGVFSDTDDAHVLSAYALGIVEGPGGGVFEPDGNITREQLAVMLTRAQAALGNSITASTLSAYTDREQFSPWAIGGIDYVTEQGVMSGIGNNRFDPKGNCTREQAIATFFRMNEGEGK